MTWEDAKPCGASGKTTWSSRLCWGLGLPLLSLIQAISISVTPNFTAARSKLFLSSHPGLPGMCPWSAKARSTLPPMPFNSCSTGAVDKSQRTCPILAQAPHACCLPTTAYSSFAKTNAAHLLDILPLQHARKSHRGAHLPLRERLTLHAIICNMQEPHGS